MAMRVQKRSESVQNYWLPV